MLRVLPIEAATKNRSEARLRAKVVPRDMVPAWNRFLRNFQKRMRCLQLVNMGVPETLLYSVIRLGDWRKKEERNNLERIAQLSAKVFS